MLYHLYNDLLLQKGKSLESAYIHKKRIQPDLLIFQEMFSLIKPYISSLSPTILTNASSNESQPESSFISFTVPFDAT